MGCYNASLESLSMLKIGFKITKESVDNEVKRMWPILEYTITKILINIKINSK